MRLLKLIWNITIGLKIVLLLKLESWHQTYRKYLFVEFKLQMNTFVRWFITFRKLRNLIFQNAS